MTQETLQVKDVMTPLATGIHPDDPLREASAQALALGVDPLPVLEGKRVIATLSEAAMQEQAEKSGLSTGQVLVKDVMDRQPLTIRLDEALDEGYRQAQKVKGSHVIVVDERGELVGTVPLEVMHQKLHQRADTAGVAAVFDVESVSDLVQFENDPLDYMNDESFPASDPIPPPSTLGPDEVDS